jgi:drug/metabolite transporter (DMT)-like permease
MTAKATTEPAAHAHPNDGGHFGAVEWGMTALVAVIWGASFLFIRVGVESFGAALVPPLRITFGLLALGCVPASRRPIEPRDWLPVAILGVIWMAAPFLLFSLAERTVPTAITGMINGAVPLSSAAVAAVWNRRVPSARRALALLVGLAGVTLVAFSAADGARDAAGHADLVGIGMLLVAVVCYGISANLALPLQRRYGALPVLFRVQAVALVVSLPFSLGSLHARPFSWFGLGCMVLLGALGTGLAYVVASVLVGRTDATRGTVGVFFTPIVATILGVLVLHERLPALTMIGALLVIVGAVLTSRREPP